jgi:hypothetical protein
MNLGLLKGWATGGPAGPTPVPQARRLRSRHRRRCHGPGVLCADGPVRRSGAGFGLRDSGAMAGVEAQVLPWPSAPARVTVKDIEALTIAPGPRIDRRRRPDRERAAGRPARMYGVEAAGSRVPKAGCTRNYLVDSASPRRRSGKRAVPAATPFVRPAPIAMPQERSFESLRAARAGKDRPSG